MTWGEAAFYFRKRVPWSFLAYNCFIINFFNHFWKFKDSKRIKSIKLKMYSRNFQQKLDHIWPKLHFIHIKFDNKFNCKWKLEFHIHVQITKILIIYIPRLCVIKLVAVATLQNFFRINITFKDFDVLFSRTSGKPHFFRYISESEKISLNWNI